MADKIFDINPKSIRGTPVFYGTRVPVRKFFDYIENGKTEAFLKDFPSVKEEQISQLIVKMRQYTDKYARRVSGGTLDYIIAVVCRHFRISVVSLRKRSREIRLACPRQVIMYFAKQMTDHSLLEIGMRVGLKNHATVIHACKKIESLMNTDEKLKASIDAIKKEIDERWKE